MFKLCLALGNSHIWQFYKVPLELPRLTVLSTLFFAWTQTADLSSSMAAIQYSDPGMPQTADLGSFMAALGR